MARKNPFGDANASGHKSGYHAWEWAMIARSRGHVEAAKAWEQADRDGWDDEHFSEERRAQLARENPKAFKPNGMMVLTGN
jgi:hypothetical protein